MTGWVRGLLRYSWLHDQLQLGGILAFSAFLIPPMPPLMLAYLHFNPYIFIVRSRYFTEAL